MAQLCAGLHFISVAAFLAGFTWWYGLTQGQPTWLVVLAGVLTLVLGLTIVNFHNIWTLDWRGFITLFGWICIFAGIFRMGFPAAVKSMGGWMMANKAFITVAAIINAALGAFLTYKGYFA